MKKPGTILKKSISMIIAAAIILSGQYMPVYAAEFEEEEEVFEENFEFVPGFAPALNDEDYETVNADPSADSFFGAEETFFVSPIATRIPSRDQGNYGTCWAFSTMAAVEMSAAKNGTELRNGKSADSSIDLSELHLAYFAGKSNEPYDPLGGFAGDRNGAAYDDFLEGGSASTGIQLLANWIGAADDKDYQYERNDSLYNFSTDRKNAIDDVMHLRGFYFADPKNDRDAVKRLIKDYGAVTAAYNETDEGLCKENNCYYLPNYYLTNHVVAIVGWDDEFSKDNFTNGQKPEGNGAWLIRNSWDAGNFIDDKGNISGKQAKHNSYFWMSYYDKSLWEGSYAVDMDCVNTYDHNYQYDGCMTGGYIYGGKKYANIFTVSGDSTQILTDVFFETHSANVDYKIDIYKGVSEGDPESGVCVVSGQSGKTSYSGGHTIALEEPVELEPGETFSVVFTVPSDTKFDVEVSASDKYYETTAHTEGRRSLTSDGGEWVTANEALNVSTDGDFRIKAFTKNGSADPVAVTGVSLSESENVKVGDTITLTPTLEPSNATDRSVTWSSSDDTVASVDKNGTVTAMKEGTADITVTTVDGGFTATCRVTVNAKEKEEIEKHEYNSSLTLIPGEVRRLAIGEDGQYVFGSKWIIESAEPKNCVSVTNGVVTAKNLPKGKTSGRAVVKAVWASDKKENSHTFDITVDGSARDNVPIIEGKKKTQITANKTLNLNVGTNGKATVSIPTGLRNLAADIKYDIENGSICKVDNPSFNSNGSKAAFEIEPLDAGATYIKWSLKDANGNETKAYTKVIVKKPVDDSLEVSKSIELKVGQGTWIKVNVNKDNTDSKDLSFSFRGKGVKVSKTGHVVATAPGAYGTITVRAGKVSRTINVTADAPKNYLALKQTSVTVTAPKAGAKAKTTKITIASPTKKQDQPTINWRIKWSDSSITIDKNGVVSVTSDAVPGIYQIVAEPSDPNSGFLEASCELIVK